MMNATTEPTSLLSTIEAEATAGTARSLAKDAGRAHDLVLCELEAPREPGLESYSPFCLKVHRALKAAGLGYASRRAVRPSEHHAVNPLGRVPVLLVDGRAIPDSSDILAFIAETRPEAISASAEEWLVEDWADTALNGFLVAARWADHRNWARVREAYFGDAPWLVRSLIAPMIRRKVMGALVARDVWRAGPEACWTAFERTLDRLDTRTRQHAFYSGPRLSVADLGIFGQLHGMRTELTAWQRDAIAARPALTRYLGRVDEATRAKA